MKSVDLVDMSIRKNWFGNIISLNFTNLLNERYEKPATYSQDGRQLSLNLRKNLVELPDKVYIINPCHILNLQQLSL